MGTAERIVLMACAIAAVLLLLWIAGESHYQSCIQRETAKVAEFGGSGDSGSSFGESSFGGFASGGVSPDIKKCSRLPF